MAFSSGKIIAGIAICIGAFTASALAQNGSDLDRIVKDKVVKLGAVEAAPWYTQDLATGKWSGVFPEIAERIFGSIGVKVEYVPTQWGTAVAALQAGQIDMMGFSPTPARALAVDFATPIGYAPAGVASKDGFASTVKTWEDLNKPEITIVAVESAATTRSAQAAAPKANWVLVPNADAMLLELDSGRATVALTGIPDIQKYIESRGNKGSYAVPEPVISLGNAYAFRRSSKDLRDWVNVAIDWYIHEKSIPAIWAKYLPTK